MSLFEDLIREWDEMMSIASGAISLEDHGISLVKEQRVLNLMARYIGKLEDMQRESDRRGSNFADRLINSLRIGEQHRDRIQEICQRFLSSVGMIFRDEIPRDLPRSKRLAARRFVVDWSSGNVVGQWPELGIAFSIRDSLAYCVEHVAGAVESFEQPIIEQYLADLQEGNLRIPRLTLIAKERFSLVFRWEDASVSLETSTQRDFNGVSDFATSPILVYFSERLEESQRRLEEELMAKAEPENPNVVASRVIDEIELADSDPIHERISKWLLNVGNYSGVSHDHLVKRFEEVAYAEASEAIVREMTAVTQKRVKVVKSLNLLRRNQQKRLQAN